MTPLALDPEATFELVLETDQDKPEGERPTFICRYLSNRDWQRIAHVNDNMQQIKEDASGVEEVLERLADALDRAVVNWRNMTDPQTGEEIPFSKENINRVLTVREVSELLQKVMKRNQLGPDAKKNSASRSPGSSEKSAATAVDTDRTVTADRPAPEQPSSSAPSAEDRENAGGSFASTAGTDDTR